MELAHREDFRDASVPVDDTVNKVGKYVSPGHSNEEAVSCSYVYKPSAMIVMKTNSLITYLVRAFHTFVGS